MILPIVSRLWQFAAEIMIVVKMVFGSGGLLAYIEDVAGTCVNYLLTENIEIYPSPPIGPGRHTTGPFFLSADNFIRIPLNSNKNTAVLSGAQVIKDAAYV